MSKAAPRIKPQRPRTPAPLPAKFAPLFWRDLDHRNSSVREVIARYKTLAQDAGADESAQRDVLVQRLVFLSVLVETMETEYHKTSQLDHGKYSALSNSLLGLVKALGLERRAKRVDLGTYLGGGKGVPDADGDGPADDR